MDAERAVVTDGTLTLVDVDSDGVSFTDRPFREAARFDVSSLVSGWSEAGFEADPPNAAIIWRRPDGTQGTAVVTLSNPEAHPLGMSFAYAEVGIAPDDVAVDVSGALDPLPMFMADVALFIDSAKRLASTSAPTSVSCSSTAHGWDLFSEENLVPAPMGNATSFYAMSCSDINAIAAAGWNGTNWASSVDYGGWLFDCAGAPPSGGILQGVCEVDSWPQGKVPGSITISGS